MLNNNSVVSQVFFMAWITWLSNCEKTCYLVYNTILNWIDDLKRLINSNLIHYYFLFYELFRLKGRSLHCRGELKFWVKIYKNLNSIWKMLFKNWMAWHKSLTKTRGKLMTQFFSIQLAFIYLFRNSIQIQQQLIEKYFSLIPEMNHLITNCENGQNQTWNN